MERRRQWQCKIKLRDKDVDVHMRRTMMAGSATSQEAGRFPGVSPPQSQRRKRRPTLPQPMADGVPSKLSTFSFSGVVHNGPQPAGVARARRVHELALPACTHATAATYTEHVGEMPDQNLAHPGSIGASYPEWTPARRYV